ncbi:hypothetical protein [Adlercreutzia caecimuris]|uniref:hypothetical protein n=1 Tax=Adlercreutzia caecimuris TaxID=671266 RepID=UPI00272CDA36|nr:hypothetical protein [Adlercreutzia caecimuris]
MEAPAYSFYAETYGGTSIEEAAWPGYARRGAAYVERLRALCKVTPYGGGEDSYALAACAAADAFQAHDAAAERAAVSSVSVGSVSTSYDAGCGGAVDLTPDGLRRSLLEAVGLYLHVFAGARR